MLMPRFTRAGLVGAGAALVLAACATSHVLIGKVRPAISPEQVQLYMTPPAAAYEQIALLETSSRGSLTFTAQGKTDKVIERLKSEAAKLGANGVLVQGIGDRPGGSIGLGLGSANFSGNSATGFGFGSAGTTYQKAASAVAIYVPN